MTYNCDNFLRLFKSDYRVFNLRNEYPDYQGVEEWAVASVLSKEELQRKYADVLKPYEPYIYLSAEMALPIVQYHSNNRKFALRAAKKGDAYGYEDDIFERFHQELVINPFEDDPHWDRLYDAIDTLEHTQKARITRHFFQGYSFTEIADEDGVSVQAVQQSISRAIVTLKNCSRPLMKYLRKIPICERSKILYII